MPGCFSVSFEPNNRHLFRLWRVVRRGPGEGPGAQGPGEYMILGPLLGAWKTAQSGCTCLRGGFPSSGGGARSQAPGELVGLWFVVCVPFAGGSGLCHVCAGVASCSLEVLLCGI